MESVDLTWALKCGMASQLKETVEPISTIWILGSEMVTRMGGSVAAGDKGLTPPAVTYRQKVELKKTFVTKRQVW